MSEMILKVAAKAVIVNSKGQVLVLREANTYEEGTQIGKWGLPGGRLNPGESYEDGFIREAREETGLDVEIGKPVYVGEWHPVIKGVPHQIIAIFCTGRSRSDKVELSEEHDQFVWVDKSSYKNYTYMNPDPIVLDTYFSSV